MATSGRPGSCIVRLRPNPMARTRLFCFPYAGAGASAYRTWPDALPGWMELCAIQPAGHETRMREPLPRSLGDVVAEVVDAIGPHSGLEFAFFGHSMGAVLAYETAAALRRAGRAGPVHLFLSGRGPPWLDDREPRLHDLPRDAFVGEVQRLYGGIPDEVLAHQELADIAIAVLRADIRMLETRAIRPPRPVDCPVTVLGGREDPGVSAGELEAWGAGSGLDTVVHTLPGGHFFLRDHVEAITGLVVRTLSRRRSGAEVRDGQPCLAPA